MRALHDGDAHQDYAQIPRNIDPQAAAVPALFAAVDADSLKAAVDAVHAAAFTFGDDYRRFLSELRAAFPAVG